MGKPSLPISHKMIVPSRSQTPTKTWIYLLRQDSPLPDVSMGQDLEVGKMQCGEDWTSRSWWSLTLVRQLWTLASVDPR